MAFKAFKAKSGLFEIHGLEAFIEKKFAELKKAFGGASKPAPKKAPARAAKKSAPAKKVSVAKDPLAAVLKSLDAHPKRAALIKAGKQKDQLLRSLIPLYVSRGGVEVSSGVTSKFWAKHKEVREANLSFRVEIALDCRFREPLECFFIIPGYALT